MSNEQKRILQENIDNIITAVKALDHVIDVEIEIVDDDGFDKQKVFVKFDNCNEYVIFEIF